MAKKSYLLLIIDITLGIIVSFLCLTAINTNMNGQITQTASRHITFPNPPASVMDTSTSTSSEKKKVALTFDDGPNEIYTPLLLDGLKSRNIKATFFLLGKEISLYPDLIQRMHEEGHVIGCHSFEHVNFGQIPETCACEQIQKTCDLITSLTHEPIAFVRPPYGTWPSCLEDDFCMIPVLWNVDPLDWATHDTNLVVNRILKTVKEDDIILLHDASQSSVDAALQVIDILQAQGYEFVTVDELILP